MLTWTACSNPNRETNEELSSESQINISNTPGKGVEFFQGSYKDALALAEQDGKLVFVFFFVDWVASNSVMREVVFRRPEVGEYFNERIVSFEVDRGKSEILMSDLVNIIDTKFDVVIPTYLVLDSEGNGLSQAHGSALPRQIISIISRAIGETDSTFAATQKKYEDGERSIDFLQQYLMEAMEELAFRTLNRQDDASIRAFRAEEAKYKQIAAEYFELKPYTDLINEIDAHLIMYFYSHAARGDVLVDFVLDHYDEFLTVTSEVEMAQFTLNATFLATSSAARTGDEKFFEYIDSLESYPLIQAVEYERKRDFYREYFPENMRKEWEITYYKARGDWDQVIEEYEKRFREQSTRVAAWDRRELAEQLLQSENPEHHKVAIKYAREAHESDQQNPQFAATYIIALITVGKKHTAVHITEEYRKGLSDSESDKERQREFDHGLSTRLEVIGESSPKKLVKFAFLVQWKLVGTDALSYI